MTADVRTFRAENMQAALDIVRREMGQDAVILHTRHVDKRRLLFFGKKQEVEVTAGIGTATRGVKATAGTIAAASASDLAPPPALLPERSAAGSSNLSAPIARAIARSLESLPSQPKSTEPKSTTDDERPGRHHVAPPKWSPNDVIVDTPSPRRSQTPRTDQPPRTDTEQRTSLPSVTTTNRLPVPNTIAARAQRLRLDPPAVAAVMAPVVAPVISTATKPDETQSLQHRLDTLQRMILELGKERTHSTLSDIPSELFPTYTQLLDHELDEDLARELVCKARDQAQRSQLRNPSAVQSLLAGLIEQEFRVGRPIQAVRGQRKVVALVGPTGVGKTTTLAKLAANLRLREGLKVGLITVDTYRIAAVEQLKTYAELIDLPMKVVTSPTEMRQALDELTGLDVVLIDTAGRSPRDDLKIQELKDCLDAAQADEVHLVLSLASGPTTLESVAANFRPVGITSLILTKLDEATGTGLLLHAARYLRTPVSYLTTGQNVPDDIEPAHPTRMTRLVLGTESVQRN